MSYKICEGFAKCETQRGLSLVVGAFLSGGKRMIENGFNIVYESYVIHTNVNMYMHGQRC
jgi:hypothetical protein